MFTKAGVLDDKSPSPGRCSTAMQRGPGRHYATAVRSMRRKWSQEENRVVMECYYRSEPVVMKTMVIPIVIGTFETVPKDLKRSLENIGTETKIDELQKSVILNTARILRKVLEV